MGESSTWHRSFNHYAYGAVAGWLYRTVAGLSPAAPGYREILFAPRPGGGLTSAAAVVQTPYGAASIAWSSDGAAFVVDVVVPAGTTARFAAPPDWSTGASDERLGSGRHHLVLKKSESTSGEQR